MVIFLTFLGCLLVILLLGKREPADLNLPKVSINTGVDHYLEMREKEVLGLQPGVYKEVIWAEKRGKKQNFLLFFCTGFRPQSSSYLHFLTLSLMGLMPIYTMLVFRGMDVGARRLAK